MTDSSTKYAPLDYQDEGNSYELSSLGDIPQTTYDLTSQQDYRVTIYRKRYQFIFLFNPNDGFGTFKDFVKYKLRNLRYTNDYESFQIGYISSNLTNVSTDLDFKALGNQRFSLIVYKESDIDTINQVLVMYELGPLVITLILGLICLYFFVR